MTLKAPSSYHPSPASRTARAFAPAKLNLHLEVGERRPDGFHGIRSLFQAISLGDSLEIVVNGREGVSIEGDFGFPAEENIIYRACLRFFEAAGVAFGVSVRVAKRIPMGGGLGGGSSDAAAALRCLNELSGQPLAPDALSSVAEGLGSDVPFFLGGPCAWVEGRGERLSPVEARGDLRCVVVEPGFSVGTAWAYAALDGSRSGSAAIASTLGMEDASRSYAEDPRSWPFFNSFEEVVFRDKPELRRIKDALLGEGALAAGMSGSGSSMYGIFMDGEDFERAEARLEATGLSARSAFLLARGQDVIVE